MGWWSAIANDRSVAIELMIDQFENSYIKPGLEMPKNTESKKKIKKN